MSHLTVLKNENGFLSDIIFNDKTFEMSPVYTQDQDRALTIYPHFTHILRFDLFDFDYIACDKIAVDRDIEEVKKSSELEKKAWLFKENKQYSEKVKNANIVINDINSYSEELFDFFDIAQFKQDGSLMKKYKVQYQSIIDQATCFIRFEIVCDNIWLHFSHNGIKDSFYIRTDKEKKDHNFTGKKKLTLASYKKALVKIKNNKQKIDALKSENSRLQFNNYL